MVTLTQKWIERYTPTSKLKKIADPQSKGLYFISRLSGRHSYVLDFCCQGQRHSLTLGRVSELSLAQAREKAAQERAKRDPRLPFQDTVPTLILFDDFGDDFLAHHGRHWKPITAKWNQTNYRLHVLPFFNGMMLQHISVENVQVWQHQQSHHGGLSLLSSMMKKAEALGLIPAGSNPCKGLRQPTQRLTGYALTPQELTLVWQGLDKGIAGCDTVTRLIRLLLLTGCRGGELRTLQQCDYRAGKLYLPDSKTGTKTVCLSSFARYWLDRQQQVSTNAFLFSDGYGEVTHGRLSRAWRAIREALNLPHVRLHDLRHTYATLALEHGEHLLNVGKLLGHEHPETTLRYAHLATSAMYQASEQVSQAIARGLQS